MGTNEKNKGLKFSQFNEPNIPKRANYLLLIAIDEYEDFPKLQNCVKDAKAVRDILWEEYQFEKNYTIELFNETATKERIFKELRWLLNHLTEEDNLVCIFSGHGEYANDILKGFWITIESKRENLDTYLSNDDIKTFLTPMKAKHIYLIIDACFAGALLKSHRISEATQKQYEKSSRFILTAGDLEPVTTGEYGDNSPFVKSLLTELKKNDSNELWGSELGNKVIRGFSPLIEARPLADSLIIEGHENGEFVFLKKNIKIPPYNGTKAPKIIIEGGNIPPPKPPLRLLGLILGFFLAIGIFLNKFWTPNGGNRNIEIKFNLSIKDKQTQNPISNALVIISNLGTTDTLGMTDTEGNISTYRKHVIDSSVLKVDASNHGYLIWSDSVKNHYDFEKMDSVFSFAIFLPIKPQPKIEFKRKKDSYTIKEGESIDLECIINNIGAANLVIDTISSSQNWLVINTPKNNIIIPPNSSSTIRLKINDGDKLSGGDYSATLKINNNDSIKYIFEVEPPEWKTVTTKVCEGIKISYTYNNGFKNYPVKSKYENGKLRLPIPSVWIDNRIKRGRLKFEYKGVIAPDTIYRLLLVNNNTKLVLPVPFQQNFLPDDCIR